MKFRIEISKALEVAEKNLKEHIKELAEDTEVWTEKVHKALNELKDAVDRQSLKASYTNIQTLFYNKPRDDRAQYSKYIGALKLAQATDDTIEMDEDDYDHLFNDNWEWRTASKASNATYTKGV